MACRPHVSVFDSNNKDTITATTKMPGVFQAPIRQDIVHFVHYNLAKNRRQAHAVFQKAGMEHSAESWGTGRAVARIPRIAGSGTRAASQGAFGNMCRHGRMFAPLKIWRRWHRKVNLTEKRHAIASAIAASAVPSLVMARGHKIMNVPEVPLVINKLNVPKTKELLKILKNFGLQDELDRVRDSRRVRNGQGKLRHHYTLKKGPLIIYDSNDNQVKRAARNIPGVDTLNVNRLNILQLCPGGHLGRMLIWTQSAFAKLHELYGTTQFGSKLKHDYHIEDSILSNADIKRIINSDEIQKVIRDPKTTSRGVVQRKNPLNNRGAMKSLNPFSELKKAEIEKAAKEAKAKRAEQIKGKRTQKKVADKSVKTLLAALEDSSKIAPKEKFVEHDDDVFQDTNVAVGIEEEVEEVVEKAPEDKKDAKKDEKKKEVKKEEKKEEKKKEKGTKK